MAKTFDAPAPQTSYGDLWQTIAARTGGPGAIDLNQARTVHNRWKTIGKLVTAGRLK